MGIGGFDEYRVLGAPNVNVRELVERFARKMEAKLQDRDNVYGDSWRDAEINFLRERLLDEVLELKSALHRKTPPDEVVSEAVDVANIAAMINERTQDQEDT